MGFFGGPKGPQLGSPAEGTPENILRGAVFWELVRFFFGGFFVGEPSGFFGGEQ